MCLYVPSLRARVLYLRRESARERECNHVRHCDECGPYLSESLKSLYVRAALRTGTAGDSLQIAPEQLRFFTIQFRF